MNASQDSAASPEAALWRFGRAELDEGTFELRVDGRVVSVERKPLEVLLCLLRHGNEIVSKEQILEAVWPGRIVTESVLTKCVAKLRDALKDNRQTMIRTQHGVGYRLTVPVRVERSRAGAIDVMSAEAVGAVSPESATTPAPGTTPASSPQRSTRRSRAVWLRAAAVLLVLTLAIATVSALRGKAHSLPVEKSVAVLPFANLSDAVDSAPFPDGLHDSVLAHLGDAVP